MVRTRGQPLNAGTRLRSAVFYFDAENDRAEISRMRVVSAFVLCFWTRAPQRGLFVMEIEWGIRSWFTALRREGKDISSIGYRHLGRNSIRGNSIGTELKRRSRSICVNLALNFSKTKFSIEKMIVFRLQLFVGIIISFVVEAVKKYILKK